MNAIQAARIKRTERFFADRPAFLRQLAREIRAHVKASAKAGLRPAVRLNGTSDLRWERIAPAIFEQFPDVQFYDYTKGAQRMRDFLAGKLPANYHLTFSRSETNAVEAWALLQEGANVAIVATREVVQAKLAPQPAAWWSNGHELPVVGIDGDAHDLR